MTRRKSPSTEHHTKRCAICLTWVDIDDIVWRRLNRFDRLIPICTDCEPEGDDCR